MANYGGAPVTVALVETDGVAIVKEVSDGLMALLKSQILPDDAGATERMNAAMHGMAAIHIYDDFPLASRLEAILDDDPQNDTKVVARLMMNLTPPPGAR